MEVGGKMGACEEVKKGMKRGRSWPWGELGAEDMKDALRRLGFCTRSTRPSFMSFGRCIKVGTMFAKCVTTRILNMVCQAQKDTDISEKPCSFSHFTFFSCPRQLNR